MVHFIYSVLVKVRDPVWEQSTYLDIRKVGSHDTVHHTPHVCDGVFVGDAHAQLFSDKRSRTLAGEEILGAHRLSLVAIHVCNVHLDGIRLILAIVLEARNPPRPLYPRVMLLDVGDEDSLNQSLVQERREWVSCIDELGARGPGGRSPDTLALAHGVPKGDFVDFCGLMVHDGALEAHVAQEVQGTRLNAVGTSSQGRLRSHIDVLDLVAPSCQTCREQQTDRAGTHDHDIVVLDGHCCRVRWNGGEREEGRGERKGSSGASPNKLTDRQTSRDRRQ